MNLFLRLSDINVSPGDVKIPQADLTSGSLQTVLQITLGIFGAIAVFMISFGAFQFVMSRGNPEATAKARNTILYSVIGLVVTLLAFAIVKFVVGKI